MATKIRRLQLRAGNAGAWTTANPILKAGEPGVELGASGVVVKLKIGDGVSDWSVLPYFSSGGGVISETDPVFSASAAFGISAGDITNWNSKLSVESDPVFVASAAHGISGGDITNWNSKQSGNANLTTISGLTPSNDDVLQRKSGAWTNRSIAQLKSDLALNNVNNTSDANKPISTATQTALDAKADLVGGVIPTSQIPSIAISDFLGDVASQVAMLALIGEVGDWCNRTDQGKTYILISGTGGSLGNWKATLTPASPVTSVNGQAGTVVLGASDIGLGAVENTALSTWAGSASLTTLGTVVTGLWHGTAITDTYISSATSWNAKQNALSGTGIVTSASGVISYINDSASKFVKADGSLDASTYLTANQNITLTGDVTGSGATGIATTIAAGVVSLSKMANMATASLIYRRTAGAGAPEVNTVAQLKTDLGLTGTNSGDQDLSTLLAKSLASGKIFVGDVTNLAAPVTMSGDATMDNAGVVTIANNAVNYGKMYNGAQMAIVYSLRSMFNY